MSVTRRYSVETVKHILKVFASSGSDSILVFPYRSSMAIFRRRPSDARGYEKNRDFRPLSRFISKIMQDFTDLK